MLVIAKRTMLFREPVTDGDALVKKPWQVHFRAGMSPQEAPDFLAEDVAFKGAVAAGVIIVLSPPKLAA
jgi:hypothetical protein